MSFLDEDSTVMSKTRELCETIAGDGDFSSLQEDVQRFFENDEVRDGFRKLQEWGDELNQKQSAGLAIADSEASDFEAARAELFKNDVAKNFITAQQTLQTLQATVSKYVGMTLELGRVPTAEDFAAQESGCCGGGGGGGCGC